MLLNSVGIIPLLTVAPPTVLVSTPLFVEFTPKYNAFSVLPSTLACVANLAVDLNCIVAPMPFVGSRLPLAIYPPPAIALVLPL